MKKLIKIFLFSTLILPANAATTPWWMRPTVCRINPTNCYSNMTYGYFIEIGNPDSWDETSNCWGLKIICPEALANGGTKPTPLKRTEIERGNKINPDYDITKLSSNRDCFGSRKTSDSGSKVSVNGKLVNVWCAGILDKPDEVFENGEITYSTQPTCKTLATNNYAATENGRCYGKYYDANQYFIECGDTLLPSRLIILNGADYTAPMNGAPTTLSAADKIFNKMYNKSKEQKSKYFAK